MKKWWFSILCFLASILIPTCTVLALLTHEEEYILYTLVLNSCIAPALLLIIIGVANTPKKKVKNEWRNWCKINGTWYYYQKTLRILHFILRLQYGLWWISWNKQKSRHFRNNADILWGISNSRFGVSTKGRESWRSLNGGSPPFFFVINLSFC